MWLIALTILTVQVSAYNVGDVHQTDSTPCIGATSEDLCEAIKHENICAYNQVPLGTRIYIEGYGWCRVADRTHPKYANRIDLAFPLEQKGEALNWGVRTKKVLIKSILQQ